MSNRTESRNFLLATQQSILVALLIIEIIVFSLLGTNFFSVANFFEVLRLSVELGLLALSQTLVIVTGGIDLSVGSLLGLCAIVLGMLWQDFHLPLWLATICALGFASLGGALNAWLITRLRIPALIVTLGSFSLFRGIAEGITGGARNYTGFPNWFLSIGQASLGPVPFQVFIFILAALFFWIILQRTTIGRALSAIGYSPDGARYAAIPVNRRLALVYILSGLSAGVAAIIYTAHWGQAKADAGTGFELDAIAAVVLGGTSIFGGSGSIIGTLLGLLLIVVLKDGIALADQPGELTAILTGALLLLAIGLDAFVSHNKTIPTQKSRAVLGPTPNPEELNMRNSQLAVLSIVILIAALIVAGGNFWLVSRIQPTSIRVESQVPDKDVTESTPQHPMTIAMMPKSKGNPYFIACRKGADEAAKELGVNLIWDGPTDPDPAKQNETVETWITRGGIDAIAAAVENRGGLSSVLKKARAHGIKVITFDADADPDARDFFVNQATPQGIGQTLMDDAAKVMNDKGDFAIITASLTASNMNEWQKYIKQRCQEKYPNIHLITIEPCDDKQAVAFDKANAILNAYPNVKLLMSICVPAVPGASEAVKQSGRTDVHVIGIGLPNDNKKYVHAGITPYVVLWNTMDLGYLTVHAAHDLADGTLKPGATSFTAGRLGKMEIKGDNILLGMPFTFTKDNIDQFDF
ncbi:MAG TPA: substrate-binding domain-containing protein [Tepidisphaeraceae bacterium]|jgi:rhamnose transport system permease protein